MNLILKLPILTALLFSLNCCFSQKLDTTLFNSQLKALIDAEAGEIDGKQIGSDGSTYESKLLLKGFKVTTIYEGQDFYKEAVYNKKADTFILVQMAESIRTLRKFKLRDSDKDSAFIRKSYPKSIGETRKIVGLDYYNRAKLFIDLYDDGKLKISLH